MKWNSKHYVLSAITLAMTQIHSVGMADEIDSGANSIPVSPVTIALIRECEVPARDSGILSSILVSEGQQVEQGESLAAMESRQQELAVEMATLAYDAVQEEAKFQGAVLAAEDGLREAQLKLSTLEFSLKAAKIHAENKSAIEIAKTDAETFLQQRNRARSAKERFNSSVSEAELTRLEAQHSKAELAVAEAMSKHLSSEIQVQMHVAELAEQQAAISRHRHLVELEQWKHQQAVKATETRRVELELAESMLDRRRIVSPISGVVTKRHRHPGEFVDAGTPVLRVIQLNELRAEGFVDISIAHQSLVGRSVKVDLRGVGGAAKSFRGTLNYVGHEVDALNQQVRVWAEFSSANQDVYPGMSAEMTILPAESSTTDVAIPADVTSKAGSEPN